MSCPRSTATGCRCPEHEPGLAAYAKDPIAYEAMLQTLRQPTRLHVVTMPGEISCNGTMTCPCNACVHDRVNRTPARATSQPWVPKPARERRAA